jgi:ABC-type nitrate/sulfonate/bicarbonate transport system substrate-binding protein
MPEFKSLRPLVGALVAACAVLVAAPVRAEVNEVRIGIQYGLIYLPVVVAEAQGFFAEEAKKAGLPDLKITVQRFSGSPAITDAVLSGNIDVGAFGTPGLLIAWEKTKGHLDVAGLAALGANAFVLMTNKPEIKTLADFTAGDDIAAGRRDAHGGGEDVWRLPPPRQPSRQHAASRRNGGAAIRARHRRLCRHGSVHRRAAQER